MSTVRLAAPTAAATVVIMAMVVMVGLAQSAPGRAQEPLEPPRLVLVDQDVAVEAGGTIRLDYELRGLVGDPLELEEESAPATPTPPTTTGAAAPGSTVGDTASPTPPPADPPPPLTVEVTNYTPLTDADDVTRVVGSDVDPDVFEEVSDVVDGVAVDVRERLSYDDGVAAFTLEIGTDVVDSVRERLRIDSAGIHPLRVQLLVGDPADDVVVATAGTIVERLPDPADPEPRPPAPPIDLSIVTVVPAPSLRADPATLALAVDELGEAVDLADAVAAPVTLEVPPALVAEAVTDDPTVAAALGDDELVALPVLPLDVSAAVAVGRGDVYTRLVAAGEDLLTEAVPGTPTRRELWIAAEPLSAAGAQQLRDLGTRVVVMTPELYRTTVGDPLPPTDLFVDAALPDGGRLPLLVLDELSTQLTTDATDRILERRTAAEWSVATIGTMLVEQRNDDDSTGSSPERSRVLSRPDLGAPDPRLLVGLESVATSTPSVRFTPGSGLARVTDQLRLEGQDVTVELPATAGPSLAERLRRIDAAELSIGSAASMLPEDDVRVAAWTDRLDELISTGYTESDVDDVLDDLVAEARELTDAVELPEPFSFTLTGRSGTIEVRLQNTSDEELRVVVDLDSTKLAFPDSPEEVVLPPMAETSVIVPVEARSNGTSSIDLTVSTPLGQQLDEPVTLTSRVTALTGLGQVLTVGFVLVLLTWWIAHWRARRRVELLDDGRGRHPSSSNAKPASEQAETGPVSSPPL